jgi:protein TonB
VTTLPKLLAQPSAEEMRRLYPPGARERGLEGNVKLKILVSDQGRVLSVRVLRPAGNGFDEVARSLVKRFRFRPGTRGGRSVPVWVPWTYKFRLSG